MQPTGELRDINSIIAGFVDRGLWYYWDTITESAGATLATTYNPFTVPIGQGSPVKTKFDTNMKTSAHFAPPRCLILDQIGFYFGSEVLKGDIDTFLNNYYFEFRIDDKIYFEGHLWYYGAGCGLTGVTTRTAESVWSISRPDVNAAIHFGDYAKYIAPLQQFSLTIIARGTAPSISSSGAGLRIVPFLAGLTDRSVQ